MASIRQCRFEGFVEIYRLLRKKYTYRKFCIQFQEIQGPYQAHPCVLTSRTSEAD